MRKVMDERTKHAALVDALVLEKALVFGRNESIAHVCRNIREWDPKAALLVVEGPGKALSLAHLRKFEALEPAGIRQVGGCLIVEVDHIAEIDGRPRNWRVLAELS